MTAPRKFTRREMLRQLDVWEGMGPLSIQGRIAKQLLAEVEAVTKRMDAWRAAAEAIEEETQWSPWYDDGPAPDSAPDLFVTARELDPEVKS